jgi:hypothetical protein
MNVEQGFAEWVEKLQLEEYYTGIYILIAAGALVIIVSFLGCVSAFMENRTLLNIVRHYVAIHFAPLADHVISSEISFVLKCNMARQLLCCVPANACA